VRVGVRCDDGGDEEEKTREGDEEDVRVVV
jgi:hypothetical protein